MEWKETSFADAVKATRRRANNLRTATRTATGATRIPPRRADLWSGDGEAVVVNSHPRPIDQSRLHRIISNVLHAPHHHTRFDRSTPPPRNVPCGRGRYLLPER